MAMGMFEMINYKPLLPPTHPKVPSFPNVYHADVIPHKCFRVCIIHA